MFNFFKKEIDNEELAYEVLEFNTEGVYSKQVKKIMNIYEDRQDIFLKAIDLIGEPRTAKARYIIAKAYLQSRYPFKLKGIEYGSKYINNELWEENCKTIVVPNNATNSMENKRNIEKTFFIDLIGKVYESEYMLEEALELYKKQLELTPFWSSGYINCANILIKLGKLNEALELLKSAKNDKYYTPYSTKRYEWETEQINDDFKWSIEKKIKEVKEKGKKEYKYKPHKSICEFEYDYYEKLSDLQKKYLEEYIQAGLVKIKTLT